MGQPPLMLLSLTVEGTAETRRLASYTSVLYKTCVAHKFGILCTDTETD